MFVLFCLEALGVVNIENPGTTAAELEVTIIAVLLMP
jgi:hypothetical protein